MKFCDLFFDKSTQKNACVEWPFSEKMKHHYMIMIWDFVFRQFWINVLWKYMFIFHIFKNFLFYFFTFSRNIFHMFHLFVNVYFTQSLRIGTCPCCLFWVKFFSKFISLSFLTYKSLHLPLTSTWKEKLEESTQCLYYETNTANNWILGRQKLSNLLHWLMNSFLFQSSN